MGGCGACRVAGALAGLGVRQVECGLNLTVALTADGRVWQMGQTCAPADSRAPWERAYIPVQAGAHLRNRPNDSSAHAMALATEPLQIALLSHSVLHRQQGCQAMHPVCELCTDYVACL